MLSAYTSVLFYISHYSRLLVVQRESKYKSEYELQITMGALVKFFFLVVAVMLCIGFVHGYNPKTNHRKIDILETKLNILETKLDGVVTELKYVKEDLKEEKEKNIKLESQLKDGTIMAPFDDKGKHIGILI